MWINMESWNFYKSFNGKIIFTFLNKFFMVSIAKKLSKIEGNNPIWLEFLGKKFKKKILFQNFHTKNSKNPPSKNFWLWPYLKHIMC